MPSPEEDTQVRVGEELIMRTRPSFDELALRVQVLEAVISRIPIVGQDYKAESGRVRLKKRTLVEDVTYQE